MRKSLNAITMSLCMVFCLISPAVLNIERVQAQATTWTAGYEGEGNYYNVPKSGSGYLIMPGDTVTFQTYLKTEAKDGTDANYATDCVITREVFAMAVTNNDYSNIATGQNLILSGKLSSKEITTDDKKDSTHNTTDTAAGYTSFTKVVTIKVVKKGNCTITVKAGSIKKTIKVKVKK